MKLFGITLGTENTKLGPVFNFSLPSRTTCPGASEWCNKHCYAYRYERRRAKCREAYERNLKAASDPVRFAETMVGILPRILPCFRIHVSGDFATANYTASWLRICLALPKVRFWTYTRSWTQGNLMPALEELRELINLQCFASTDTTMPLPPKGWRVAYVDHDPRAEGILCPEQTGEAKSCLDCGYCFMQHTGNVIFKVR